MAAGSRAADAPEQPRSGGRRAPGQAGGLRRHRQGRPGLELLRRDGPHPARAEAGRDHARPVRPPGRRPADPRVGAAGADRQLQPGRRLGHLGGVPPPGGARPDHVRADDRRVVDLHRHPGHPPGHLRDLRRRRRQAVQRDAGRHHHPHRRARRHGRRPAARGHHERRRGHLRRLRPAGHRPADRAPLPRRQGRLPRRRPAAGDRGPRRPSSALHRRPRQRGRPRAAAARHGSPDRHRHRPDLGPRPARLPPHRCRPRRHDRLCHREARRVHRTGPRIHGQARGSDGRLPGSGRRGLRLRQLHPRRGPARRVRAGLRLPRLRARLHPAALQRGQGPLPVGRPLRRPRRHRRHRPGDPRPLPGERVAGPLDQARR